MLQQRWWPVVAIAICAATCNSSPVLAQEAGGSPGTQAETGQAAVKKENQQKAKTEAESEPQKENKEAAGKESKKENNEKKAEDKQPSQPQPGSDDAAVGVGKRTSGLPPVGYSDTVLIPGQQWKVHDIARPEPAIIEPGRAGTQDQAGTAPSDAVVLFDGRDLSRWVGQGNKDAAWTVKDGYMEVNGTGSIRTRESFGSCQLHVEWATPAEVKGESQGRGNSGILLMGLYEIQILDSFENRTYADGQAASIYGQFPPLVNASRKPGEWQTYDIVFEAPVFEGDKLLRPAHFTVFHNGVLVHHHTAGVGRVQHKDPAYYAPHPEKLPLMLQDHNNPVRFRNVWLRPLGTYDQ